MKPFKAPSERTRKGSQSAVFLAIPEFRKLWNKLLAKSKKICNDEATIFFLEQCIALKVIPNSYLPRLKAKESKSSAFKEEWFKSLKQEALRLIQKTVEDDRISLAKSVEEIDSQYNIIRHLVESYDVNMVEELRVRFMSRTSSFKKYAMDKKVKKLNFLSSIQNVQNVEHTSNDIEAKGEPSKNVNNVNKTEDEFNVINDDTPKTKKAKCKWVKKSKYRRLLKQKKKAKVNAVFNYSGIELSAGAIKVLNKGLNYCILPDKLNISQVLCDLSELDRKMQWTEYHFDGEEKEPYVPPLFKKKKYNFPPKEYNVPKGLERFIGALRSELSNPQNRVKQRPNLPPDEAAGLKELIQLQKDRKICIKPADKGAGIIVLSFEAYMSSCYKHLNSVQKQKDGTYKRYYEPVEDPGLVDDVRKLIEDIIQEGLKEEYISEDYAEAMNPMDKGVGKFYQTFKIHKEHIAPHTPPERPIISCCGSMNENIGKFVEFHLKDVANVHSTYLQDTPHFLREIEALKSSGVIKDGDILASIDITGLYTNIPQSEGLDACKEALDERTDKSVPTDFIMKLLEVILQYNIFEFNQELFIQMIGCAMGAVPSVSYANIFLAKKVDPKIIEAAKKFKQNGEDSLIFMKRFLDDLFLVWRGTAKKFHEFMEKINQIHPQIKFTFSHTSPNDQEDNCSCSHKESLSFLDTSCSIENGTIQTDLYRKETDRNLYLLTSSCHPASVITSIPLSLSIRILRICSTTEAREKRFAELRQLLIDRDYKPSMVDAAIDQARKMDRLEALKKVSRNKNTDRVCFVLTYDSRLPAVPALVTKHWYSMIQDPYLKAVFPKPPLVSFRRQKNIRQKVIRATVPPAPSRPTRILPGMKPCGHCAQCPFIMSGKVVKASASNFQVEHTESLNCESERIIYLIECDKPACKGIQYVGKFYGMAKTRLSSHRSSINTKQLKKTIGAHFNGPGHSECNLKFTILERVSSKNPLYLREREIYYMQKFNTKMHGLNIYS